MKALAWTAVVTAVALGVVAASVLAGHDTAMLVSPPEAVAEQFARKLVAGRYDVARAHLEDDSPAMRELVRTTSDALRARAGVVSQVAGQAGAIEGERATATAVMTTRLAGEVVMTCALVRRTGSWRITSFRIE